MGSSAQAIQRGSETWQKEQQRPVQVDTAKAALVEGRKDLDLHTNKMPSRETKAQARSQQPRVTSGNLGACERPAKGSISASLCLRITRPLPGGKEDAVELCLFLFLVSH